jgi:N-acetylglucosaminyldiphosphoundecaprenol N-acetyl-beta-D-mannosaminyltransferase
MDRTFDRMAPTVSDVRADDVWKETASSLTVGKSKGAGSCAECDDAPVVAPNYHRRVYCLAGLAIDVESTGHVAARVRRAAATRRRLHLATPNMNILRLARQEIDVREALLASDLCVADGMPVVWLARLQGIPLRRRVAGADVFEVLCDVPCERTGALKVHFFGGEPGHGGRLRAALDTVPGVGFAGATSPGFGDVAALGADRLVERVNASGADMVLVSVSARKGLLWIARNEQRLRPSVVANLGAVIDFTAGTARRAPAWMQRSGVEWAWRMFGRPALLLRYAADFVTLAQLAPRCAALGLLRRRGAPIGADRPWLRIEHVGRRNILHLGGDWTLSDLQPLRVALEALAGARKDLVVELRACAGIDAATLGLLLVARGHQSRNGRRLCLTGAGIKLSLLLRAHGCGFLMERVPGDGRAEAAPSPSRTSASGSRYGLGRA